MNATEHEKVSKAREALANIDAIDDGDKPELWDYGQEFDAVREAIAALDELLARPVEPTNERMEDALHRIKSWSEAYPLSVFPEPDFKKAHEVLTAHGMTLDAISASNMRHIIKTVQSIAEAALAASTQPPKQVDAK